MINKPLRIQKNDPSEQKGYIIGRKKETGLKDIILLTIKVSSDLRIGKPGDGHHFIVNK